MRQRIDIYYLKFLFLLLLTAIGVSCSTIKYVPEGEALLNKTKIEVIDTKAVSGDELKHYLHQRENAEVLGFWKMQLNLYSLSGADTTKWINRSLRKMGQAPEIYSEALTVSSMQEIQKAMQNKGYFNATVDTLKENALAKHNKKTSQRNAIIIDTHKNDSAKGKMNLTYVVTANQSYTLRSYYVEFTEAETTNREAYLALREAALNQRRTLIKTGMLFDTDVLNEERERISNYMRRHGYYFFDKECLHYDADSALQTHEVRLTLRLNDNIKEAPDSVRRHLFTPQTIDKVIFHTEYNQLIYTRADLDTLHINDYIFSWTGKKIMREKTLMRYCAIQPHKRYSARDVENTYSQLNALGPVKYVNISFHPTTDSTLVAFITLSKDKIHSVSAELEGTYSAGDWGIAAGVGYQNRNIFGGAEQLNINARGSYEWRANGGRAIEAKINANLRFPDNWSLQVGYQFQKRPEEYTRTIANAAIQYHLTTNRRFKQYFNLLEISYVYLPWISDEFRNYFLQNSNLLKYSFEDHFIMDWSYGGSYSSYIQTQPNRSYTTFQYAVETAGNALYGLSTALDAKYPKNENGMYEIFHIPYAQYAKADFNITYNQIFNEHHRLVYHADLGIAFPYGNAKTIPFEKRYFAGGANGVRGWNMRTLGPGGYRSTGNRIDYHNQAGDLRLTLNLEYRWKLGSWVEWAFFTDAGNVWTIRDYDTQPNGLITKDFYKQIAWSYGTGIRLDFDFFIFRIDLGVKLYDPSRMDNATQWRTVPNGLRWKDDCTLHFAIGYPF